MEIPPKILSKLKCNDCDTYLSSSPVFLRENGENICGFCSTSDDINRITLYEELAQLMLFPCKNEKYGCQQKLRFNDQSDHENVCEFQETICPFLEHGNCEWVGGNTDIFNHFDREHKGKVLVNIGEYEITKEIFEFFVISAFDKLFTLRMKIVESTGFIFHSICSIDESSCSEYNYDLKIHNKSAKDVKLSSDMKKIQLKETLSKFEIEIKLKNLKNNTNILIILYNDGPIDNRWSIYYEESKTNCPNCQFFDITTKFEKHESHFCKNSSWCELCAKDMTESREEHRSSAHGDIISQNGTSWNAELSKERHWRIISSDVGDLLCSYYITLSAGVDVLEVRVISPLTRRQLARYTCVFEIDGLERKLDMQKDDYIDWHTQIEWNQKYNKMYSFKINLIRNDL